MIYSAKYFATFLLWIFPVAVLGSSSAKCIFSGILKLAMEFEQNSCISFSDTSELITNAACTTSPYFSSGKAKHTASLTLG